MRNSTLLFPIQREKGKISKICLAMKKRGFGKGHWNGTGGKVMAHESIEDGARRETTEEITIVPKEVRKIAEISFFFPEKPEWDQMVHVFFCESWDGEPDESEEMAPKWFKVADIPFSSMWPDDIFWLPRVIKGDMIKASFVFGPDDTILEQNIKSVKNL